MTDPTVDSDDEPDFDWVLPDLAIGGRLSPSLAVALAGRHGIRRVVDLREEEQDDAEVLRTQGVELLLLPTPDHAAVAPEALWAGVEWVREGLARGDRVLIHCQHGIGRSALLACCVLVARGDTPVLALERAKRARARVCPSPGQLQALLAWSADWYRRRAEACPAATWHDLARIAYRQLAEEAARQERRR